MLTYGMMALILAAMALLWLYRDAKGKQTAFFDMESTNCMRGFFSIVVLLVHIPEAYQNPIQDAVGSFAYIAVTFFFVTSGYGLYIAVMKNPDGFRSGFWKRRLVKLLIPLALVNVLRMFATSVSLQAFQWIEFVSVNGFVRQLLALYLLFWIVFGLLPDQVSFRIKQNLIVLLVVLFSITLYIIGDNPLFLWPAEALGFVYGILLARYKNVFENFAARRWLLKFFVIAGIAMALGLGYLKWKSILFFGDYLLKSVLCIAILLLLLFWNHKISLGNPLSRFLGGISYEVYLVHDVVFVTLTLLPIAFDSGVFVLCSLLLTIVLSYLVNLGSKLLLSFFKKCR